MIPDTNMQTHTCRHMHADTYMRTHFCRHILADTHMPTPTCRHMCRELCIGKYVSAIVCWQECVGKNVSACMCRHACVGKYAFASLCRQECVGMHVSASMCRQICVSMYVLGHTYRHVCVGKLQLQPLPHPPKHLSLFLPATQPPKALMYFSVSPAQESVAAATSLAHSGPGTLHHTTARRSTRHTYKHLRKTTAYSMVSSMQSCRSRSAIPGPLHLP